MTRTLALVGALLLTPTALGATTGVTVEPIPVLGRIAAESTPALNYRATTEPLSAPNYRLQGWSDRSAPPKDPKFHIVLFSQATELNELDLKPTNGGATSKVTDIRRSRAGVTAQFGPSFARGYFQVFAEKLDRTTQGGVTDNTEWKGAGGGIGIRGEPTLHRFSGNQSIFLPYRAEVNVVLIDDGQAQKTELGYAELIGEVGFGYNWRGLQPSVGITSDTLVGKFKNDAVGFIENDLEGTNVGFYGDLKYKHPDFPLWVQARAIGGNIRGGMLSIGASF